MSKFRPVHFVPAKRQAAMLALPVEKVIAVPHRKQGGTNHWCFYLMTSPETSVRIDCQPCHMEPGSVIRGGYKANLIVSELMYLVSTDAQEQFMLDVATGLSVEHFYDGIIQHGRHSLISFASFKSLPTDPKLQQQRPGFSSYGPTKRHSRLTKEPITNKY
ncbi:unnamed protein product, partial [Penicillium palitans]